MPVAASSTVWANLSTGPLSTLHLDTLSAARLNRGLRDASPAAKAWVGCALCRSSTRPAIVLTRVGWACGTCSWPSNAIISLQAHWRGAHARRECAVLRRRKETVERQRQAALLEALATWRGGRRMTRAAYPQVLQARRVRPSPPSIPLAAADRLRLSFLQWRATAQPARDARYAESVRMRACVGRWRQHARRQEAEHLLDLGLPDLPNDCN